MSCAGRSPVASTNSSVCCYIVVAIILAAGIYFDFAGILGDGIEWLGGALAGLGRYVLPIILLAVGVSFIRSNRSSSPYRLVIGWALVGLTTLGIIHVVRGPEGFSVNGVTDSGGVIGWAAGEPLRTLMAEFGSIVVLVALGIGGALLITQASLRTIATRTGRGAGIDRPPGRSGDPQGAGQPVVVEQRQRVGQRRTSTTLAGEGVDDAGETITLALPPAPYDAADDFGADSGAGTSRRRRKRARRRRTTARRVPRALAIGSCPRCRCSIVAPRRASTRVRRPDVAGSSSSPSSSTASTRRWRE